MAITCDLCGKSVKAPQNLRIHKLMKHGVQPDGQASATPAAVATLADSEKTELAQLRELRDGWQVAVATPENFTRLGASLGYAVNASGSTAEAAGKELEQPAKEAPMTRLERIGAALLEERKGLLAFCFKRLVTALGPADEGYDWAMDKEPSYGGIRVIQVQRTTGAQSTTFGNTRFKAGVFCDLVDFAIRAMEIHSRSQSRSK